MKPSPALADQKTCRLVTLGCRVNQYETQLVKEALEKHGYREADEGEAADLCVVNTCTVTSNGDSRSRQVIRQLARNNPGTRTLVMGCYATNDPETVRSLPGVFEVVTDKRELPDVLARHGIHDMPAGISRFPGRKRAYVKVQDGCILRCSYCIIPHVRPGLRSRSPDDIEDEVRRLLDHGHQEIVLTGIHLGHFGVDTTRGKSGKSHFRLGHLLHRLDCIPGRWRMRLSSIESAEITDDFLAAAADCEHLCPHFHPALQSGSTTVLRRMRRRYSAERFLRTVHQLQERFDNPGLSTDVIVGFPGETDAEFDETVAVCREAGFHKLHLFPFSARRGTPAAELPDKIPDSVVQERMKILESVAESLTAEYHQRLIGHPLEVLVENCSESRRGFVAGTDRRYVTVELPGDAADVNTLVEATGIGASRLALEAQRRTENDVTQRFQVGLPVD
ncbi:MAG TPA: tRNA (N(6)-L-threonylcarbamoyladenosine(37)-C(2))-methylthiotransferase MtaB [Planctomycetaceae bacterium]|nr:tRNA (N(6)-L-threonylcarbamoyladenosine(37)-C(2))-methylthiotransferase MtaB [Planctomycetaceae bacterium]